MSDLWTRDATGLVDAYRAGAVGPVEAVGEALDRIARLDPALGAFVALNPNAVAEAEASAARWREGAPLGPLDGVPVAVKDNLAVRSMPARWGGPAFPAAPLEADELPVARLRAAGAIVLGKTNTPEFAVEGYTGNALFGDTGNPWAPDLTPGGSSGGSVAAVAAVAAGMAPLALGIDGGGSLRRSTPPSPRGSGRPRPERPAGRAAARRRSRRRAAAAGDGRALQAGAGRVERFFRSGQALTRRR